MGLTAERLAVKYNISREEQDKFAYASQMKAAKAQEFGAFKVNVNGGAIALGHPTGASGAVLLAKLIYSMKKRSAETGLVTLCIGGGQRMFINLKTCSKSKTFIYLFK